MALARALPPKDEPPVAAETVCRVGRRVPRAEG